MDDDYGLDTSLSKLSANDLLMKRNAKGETPLQVAVIKVISRRLYVLSLLHICMFGCLLFVHNKEKPCNIIQQATDLINLGHF